jgi:hypothetical protein
MCAEAGLPDPGQAAAEITFVLEGAQVCAQNGSVDQAGDRLMNMVRRILDQHRSSVSSLDRSRTTTG